MFKPIKKAYTFEEIENWILITRTTMYKTFISSLEHPPIYIKKKNYIERILKTLLLRTLLRKSQGMA